MITNKESYDAMIEQQTREINNLKTMKRDCHVQEIVAINTFLERLKGYGCGYHKILEKQMLNRIKKLEYQIKYKTHKNRKVKNG